MHRFVSRSGFPKLSEVLMPSDESMAPDVRPLILIANDQEWTGRAIESILGANGYRVVHAYTARDALALAAETRPDLVLLDQQLPDLPGTEVCRQLRADPRFGPSLPIIITTAGPSGRPQRMNAYAAGAWEFYGQPLDAEALLHKLTVYLAAHDEAQRLRDVALIDDATGLYNQAGLARRATELIAEARRIGRAITCVGWSLQDVADVDMTARAASQFRACGRAADILGRLDNGAFAVVAGGVSQAGAARLGSRFQEILAKALGVDINQVRTTIVSGGDPNELPPDGEHLVKQLGMAFAA
jgi:CheY-like chemotaxis protein/GGDEF domain-containing protein